MKIIELDEGIFDRFSNWLGANSQNEPTAQSSQASSEPTNTVSQQPIQPAQQDQNTKLKSVKYQPGARGPVIADLQKVLAALGYEQQVGTPDGVFGSGTIKAIAQFQKDQNLPKQFGEVDQATITKLNQLISSQLQGQLAKSTQADVAAPRPKRAPMALPEVEPIVAKNSAKGKAAAEQYLGRKLFPQEWNYLVRTAAAESSNNSKEQAYIMGVILNRVRSGRWGSDVMSVLGAANQFQAVTGTSEEPGPSELFYNPGSKTNSVVNAAINLLPQAPKNYLSFTAANAAAYGPGTDSDYLKRLLANGGEQVGGTVFAP